MSQTLSLYRLQQIDSQLDRVQARLQAIQQILEDDTELRLVKEKAQEAETQCQVAEKTLKQADTEIQNQHVKIEQIESSLYVKSNHSPKELQDLQNDVAALKRHRATLEDHMLEAMQASETAEVKRQASQADLSAAQNRRKEQNKELQEEQNALRNDAERLSTERNAVAGPIPAAELGIYDQLRQQRRGVAVAVISEKSCSACGSSLSAAQIQLARGSGSIALCPSCGRILYGS